MDEDNVVAHLRVSDRTDADGKKVLFIEELQSDWHQQGRQFGYATKADEKEILNLKTTQVALDDEFMALKAKAEDAGFEFGMSGGGAYITKGNGHILGFIRTQDKPFAVEWKEEASELSKVKLVSSSSMAPSKVS